MGKTKSKPLDARHCRETAWERHGMCELVYQNFLSSLNGDMQLIVTNFKMKRGGKKMVSPFLRTTKALRESRGISLLCFQTSALEGDELPASRPGRILPPGKTRYPFYRRLGGLQGRSGQVRKISLHVDSIPEPSSP
jgi:hypothetical protein